MLTRPFFSNLPELTNTSLGINSFFLLVEIQKKISLSSLNEYRCGGEMTNKPKKLAQQAEDRSHYMGKYQPERDH